MEHADSRTLTELLELGTLPVARAIRWTAQLAVALAEAHAAGRVHGNLNPDNVIVNADDSATLRDLGASPATDRSAGPRPTRINYLAPEQIMRGTASTAADVFAFGAVAYVMFAGRDAFPADLGPSDLLKRDPPRLTELRSDLDAAVAALIDACLQKDAAQRPTMKHVAERLSRELPAPTAMELDELRRELEDIKRRPPPARAAPPPPAQPAQPPAAPTPPRPTAAAPPRPPATAAPPPRPAGVPAEDVEEARATRVDENVQFSVYRPDVIAPDTWYSMVLFAHLASRRPDAPSDERDPLDEVDRRARQIFGPDATTSSRVDAMAAIPEEGQLRVKPSVPGIEFNPPEQSFIWLESVHQVDFRMRAHARLVGTVARGSIAVYLGVLPIAEMAIAIPVTANAPARGPSKRGVMNPYRRIFASYSHKDEVVVREFARYAMGMGDRYMRDVIDLRAGERWQPRLCEMIESADVFQLFWSTNSMDSTFVRQEWEHALTVNKLGFVRPLYWEIPFPRREGLPPPSLDAIQFAFVGGRARSSPRAEEVETVLADDAASPVRAKRQPLWLMGLLAAVGVLLAIFVLRAC